MITAMATLPLFSRLPIMHAWLIACMWKTWRNFLPAAVWTSALKANEFPGAVLGEAAATVRGIRQTTRCSPRAAQGPFHAHPVVVTAAHPSAGVGGFFAFLGPPWHHFRVVPSFPANPQDFVGKPLTLWKTVIGGETRRHDYVVMCGVDWPVGRILLADQVKRTDPWQWSVTGPGIPDDLQPSGGRAETLDAAKAEVRAKFNAWLTWALAQGGPQPWTKGGTPLRPLPVPRP